MEGAVQGNHEGKMDKWLIVLTVLVETDLVRDGERDRDTEKERIKEMVNKSCSVSPWRETRRKHGTSSSPW